ncbi:hypothetical protein KAI87_16805, partial [Myxococcota bacterium]|nr:hypothetical protein [Myxococcota bacterium]
VYGDGSRLPKTISPMGSLPPTEALQTLGGRRLIGYDANGLVSYHLKQDGEVTYETPHSTPLTDNLPGGPGLAISPDQRYLFYMSESGLVARYASSLQSAPLALGALTTASPLLQADATGSILFASNSTTGESFALSLDGSAQTLSENVESCGVISATGQVLGMWPMRDAPGKALQLIFVEEADGTATLSVFELIATEGSFSRRCLSSRITQTVPIAAEYLPEKHYLAILTPDVISEMDQVMFLSAKDLTKIAGSESTVMAGSALVHLPPADYFPPSIVTVGSAEIYFREYSVSPSPGGAK